MKAKQLPSEEILKHHMKLVKDELANLTITRCGWCCKEGVDGVVRGAIKSFLMGKPWYRIHPQMEVLELGILEEGCRGPSPTSPRFCASSIRATTGVGATRHRAGA